MSKNISKYFAILAVSIIITLLVLNPENFVPWQIVTLLFVILAIKKPLFGFYAILLMPVLGELSRFALAGQSLILSDIFIPIFFVIWIFHPETKSKIKTHFTKETRNLLIILSAFVITAILSIFLSLIDIPAKEVLKGALYLARLISYLLLLPIAATLTTNTKETKKILIFSVLLLALTGFVQLVIFPNLTTLEEFGYDPHMGRLVGTWLDPNFIGGLFAFTITILTALFFNRQNLRSRITIASIITILLIATFLTYSRSAYLSLAAGLFIVGIFKSRKLIIILAILGILAFNVSARVHDRVSELFTSVTSIFNLSAENPDPTARLRIENWNQTLTLIEEKPILGIGYNNLAYSKLEHGFIKSEDIHSASGSDSSLLAITATTGLIGLLVFLFFWLKISLLAIKTFINKNNLPESTKNLGLGIFASIIALFIHSVFINSLLFAPMQIFYLTTIALFLNEINKQTQSKPHSSRNQSQEI